MLQQLLCVALITFVSKWLLLEDSPWPKVLSTLAETVKSALDILKICSLTSPTQLLFCEKISSPAYLHVTGINVLLQAAEGELMPVPDIQRAALEIIINCVCTKLPSSGAENSSRPSLASKKKVLSQEEHLSKLWKSVRIKNGIIVLINLLSIKSPLTDADSIRALACKALCGLARSDHVKQIISKLPLVTDGQLLDLMKEPVLQDKGNDHVLFCKYGLELIQRVTGAPISEGSELSMLNINKSEIVAKTKVVYNEAQLLQLISDHLKEHGFYETAECLQREMSKKLISAPSSSSIRTPTRPALWSVWNAGKEKFPKFNNSALTQSSNSSSAMSIPPPSVPLRINRRLKVINKTPQYTEIKSLSGRLQKPQTCSGNYVQSPALRHQEAITPSFGGGSQSSISLHSIVTEYLRKQHALCKNPMITCPPFNLYVPHKCPEPHYRQNAPVNYVLRLHKREMATANGGIGGAALNRKHIYSRFRLVRTFRDVEGNFDFCTSSFLNYNYNKRHPRILIGTVNGTVKVFNVNTANQEFSQDCHVRGVSHVESKEYSPLVITSDGGRLGNSSIWNTEGGVDLLHNFYEVSHMEFGKRTVDRAVGTKHSSASIFDTATFAELQHFPSEELGNNYTPNRATFDYSDQLILSDGLVWDIRSGQMIHKLDKFNAVHNGVFHPNGREIISNSEIWDLRTFKLLRTVAGLSQRCVTFNPAGNIIYGVCTPTDSESKMTENEINCFYVFDADDYNSIATIDVKKPVFHVAADLNEQYVAVVEMQSTVDHFSVSAVAGADSVCRLYEIGRTKEEGDEDGEETEDSDDASDEEDNEGESMEIENGDDDDDDDDINHYFIQELSSEEDDETLFSLNTSVEDNL
ncbi:DDB1- and CUL4-associated factor 1-like [Stegodyphus dumicola]|uniref:DDB1- and CUL4-associated factor 1-like n=1 Tax=Stegodyphus dumicola TaxID=202533 RepID=UPI0015AF2B04|nr:DDB1- and CUL4-associated factor 1-like [Stegodyphus dumicola]